LAALPVSSAADFFCSFKRAEKDFYKNLGQKKVITMSVNQTLCRLRSEKGLSRKNVAKATGIPSLRLCLYEQGYLALPRYLIPCLCQFYQVTPEAFADPLGYPTPCFDNVKKPLPPFVQKA
jgi:hypothetical protein